MSPWTRMLPILSPRRHTSREQTVEIARGPKGAFDNGNIGAVMRQVATAVVINAALCPGFPVPTGYPENSFFTPKLAVVCMGFAFHMDSSSNRSKKH